MGGPGTPTNPVLYNGRIWCAYTTSVYSAPIGSDLLNANSWTRSDAPARNSYFGLSSLLWFEWQLMASSATAFNIGGTMDRGLAAAGRSFDLLNGVEYLSGRQFQSVALPTLSGGLTWDTTNLYSSGVIAVVPEPASVTLLGPLGVLLGMGSWMQRSQSTNKQ